MLYKIDYRKTRGRNTVGYAFVIFGMVFLGVLFATLGPSFLEPYKYDKKVSPYDICAVALDAATHTAVIMDENFNVIRPSIYWTDTRSIEEVKYLSKISNAVSAKKSSASANIHHLPFATDKPRFRARPAPLLSALEIRCNWTSLLFNESNSYSLDTSSLLSSTTMISVSFRFGIELMQRSKSLGIFLCGIIIE